MGGGRTHVQSTLLLNHRNDALSHSGNGETNQTRNHDFGLVRMQTLVWCECIPNPSILAQRGHRCGSVRMHTEPVTTLDDTHLATEHRGHPNHAITQTNRLWQHAWRTWKAGALGKLTPLKKEKQHERSGRKDFASTAIVISLSVYFYSVDLYVC